MLLYYVNQGDGSWETAANWFEDEAAQVPHGAVPLSTDSVQILANGAVTATNPVTVANCTLGDPVYWETQSQRAYNDNFIVPYLTVTNDFEVYLNSGSLTFNDLTVGTVLITKQFPTYSPNFTVVNLVGESVYIKNVYSGSGFLTLKADDSIVLAGVLFGNCQASGLVISANNTTPTFELKEGASVCFSECYLDVILSDYSQFLNTVDFSATMNIRKNLLFKDSAYTSMPLIGYYDDILNTYPHLTWRSSSITATGGFKTFIIGYMPEAVDVRSGSTTTFTTGTLAVPLAANVRYNIAVDAGFGTCHVPLPSNVKKGVQVDNTVGTLVVSDILGAGLL